MIWSVLRCLQGVGYRGLVRFVVVRSGGSELSLLICRGHRWSELTDVMSAGGYDAGVS